MILLIVFLLLLSFCFFRFYKQRAKLDEKIKSDNHYIYFVQVLLNKLNEYSDESRNSLLRKLDQYDDDLLMTLITSELSQCEIKDGNIERYLKSVDIIENIDIYRTNFLKKSRI